jgi:hypothetical protein
MGIPVGREGLESSEDHSRVSGNDNGEKAMNKRRRYLAKRRRRLARLKAQWMTFRIRLEELVKQQAVHLVGYYEEDNQL